MTIILEDHKEAIAELCRRYRVQNLFAYDSAVRDDFRPGDSDVDLLVEYAPIGEQAIFHAYFGMLDDLQRLLDAKADLVIGGAVSYAIIAREIASTNRMIYVA